MENISPTTPVSHKTEGVEQVSCLDTLRSNGAISWGTKKNVRYKARKVEVNSMESLCGEDESESKWKERAEQGMAVIEVEEKLLEGKKHREGKRLRDRSSGSDGRTPKKIAGRWSYERVEFAKKALQEVVKEMDATWRKPVLRQDLREKARKLIGDTGLLDHLLKHMAGEVFSDGTERLIRRHNTEGAIEYWLEPAELAKIRQDAGINPYWVPPPGWKHGDAIPNNDSCVGRCMEMNFQLKEEVILLKREVIELKSLKELMKSQQENYQSLLIQHGKLQEQVTEISTAYLSMKEDLDKHSMQEKGKGKQVAAGDEVGRRDKTARKSAFRTCKPDGTFLWPNMESAGETSAYSTSPAMSVPPQLMLFHGPTSPQYPSLHPAFFSQPSCLSFHQQQPDSQLGRIQTFSQAQSQEVFAQSLSRGLVHRPTAAYPSTEMNKSGASGRMNSQNKDDVETDLALASFNYI